MLNLWEAEGKGPRPLIVEIHGGGWTQQDYRQVLPGTGYVPLGISYASIEYRRLCDDQVFSRTDPRAKDCGPLPAPVLDAARALQFIKSKAKEWNIDPDRIILKGGSAGGCSALWLNYHPDLADPTSADPVARQSTKVLATIANSAQSTIDPKTINGWGMGPQVLEHFMMRDAVGVISKGENSGLRLGMIVSVCRAEPLACVCVCPQPARPRRSLRCTRSTRRSSTSPSTAAGRHRRSS